MSQWPVPPPYGPPPLPPTGQQPLPPPPVGQLVLNVRKPFGPFAVLIGTPDVWIGGYRVPVSFGPNAFQVAAGRQIIQVEDGVLIKYGQATMAVNIYPGQSIEVHYSPPIVQMMPGRMGFEVQPRPGWEVFWIMILVCAVFPTVLVLAINWPLLFGP